MVCPCVLSPNNPCYLISPNLFSHGVLLILPQATMASKPNQQFPCLFYIEHVFSISDEDIMMDPDSAYTVHSGQDFAAPLLSPQYSWPLIIPPVISLPFLCLPYFVIAYII
ncbi:hypothetical protein Hanom_Chr06g00495711 [Helianthus anomalus]